MNAEEKVYEYIDAIASNLGVAAEHVYGALLKQAVVSGVLSGGVVMITLAAIVTYLIYLRRMHDMIERETDAGVSAIILIASAGVLILILGAAAHNTVTAFYNPEYWALKEILSSIKSD